jgi:uncharacterized protein involved in response to NO
MISSIRLKASRVTLPKQSHQVHEPYVFAALAFALTAGFGLAAILVAALALHGRIPLGVWWVALVQAHGHAQLFGWAGLFVLGVGLFFLPRLRGTTLTRVELAPWALACFAVGITLHALSQSLFGIFAAQMSSESLWRLLGRSGLALSGVIELVGAVLIVVMLVSSFRRARPLGPDAPITPVLPYLATAFINLIAAVLLNAALASATALRGSYLYPSAWNNTLTHLFIMGFIIPVALSLSIRNLPLFMRLTFPPRRELAPIWVSYVIGLILRLVGQLEHPFGFDPNLSARLGGLGTILEGSALLVFIWLLDVLLRRKRPWTESRILRKSPRGRNSSALELDDARDDLRSTPPEIATARKPTRKNYPDYGEFGRFELLIISAYAWLTFASVIALLNGAIVLLGSPTLFNPDIERHAITVGFITLLIFGMAVRMLPGFGGKTRVASTHLVLVTFWLGNLATLFRVAPLLVPDIPGATAVLASSGVIAWPGVACLAANLWRTWQR